MQHLFIVFKFSSSDSLTTVRLSVVKYDLGSTTATSVCITVKNWRLIQNVISVAVWIHPGPGGGPPPFARV